MSSSILKILKRDMANAKRTVTHTNRAKLVY